MGTAPRIAGLDALRGIAALMVLALHTQAVFGGAKWFGKGYLAVDFFLMLSGFLMVRVTEPRIARGLPALRFMAARYRRFWATVALGSVIGAPYLLARSTGAGEFLPVFAANLALVPFAFRNLMFALNIPAWTIFFELVANAAHVFALRKVPTPGLALLTALVLGLAVWAAIAFGSLDLGARPATFLAGFPRIFLAYGFGMLIARVWREEPPLGVPGWLALVLMPAAVMASYATGRTIGWQFDLAFVLVICPLTIFGGWHAKGFGALGKWSAAFAFPLFATHVPILEGMRELGFDAVAAVPTALAFAALVTWWTMRRDRSSI